MMKLNNKRVFCIGLAFLSIAAFWQMYDSMIPLILRNTFGLGETITGVIMALDNVLALFLLPLIGSLSDKTNTRIGKRMPYILAGTLFASALLLALAFADRAVNLILFVVILFGLLVAMGLYRSPAVALMPDLTPAPLRSKANAIINLLGAVGGVYALIMIKILAGKGGKPDYFPLFFSIAALMVGAIVILFLTINEKKLSAEVQEKEAERIGDEAQEKQKQQDRKKEEYQREEKHGIEDKQVMKPEVKRSLLFLLASVFLWFMAYNAVTTAFSRYAGVVWGLKGGGFADCLMVATVSAIISYIPIGMLASRIGRKKTILGGIILMSFCYLSAVFVVTFTPLINIAFALIGIGWAAINVNSYPMVVEMGKGSEVGKFTGTYYTFSMAAQIVTPVLSGLLLEKISYRTLFPYAVVFSAAAFMTMIQVRHGDSRPKKRSALEQYDTED